MARNHTENRWFSKRATMSQERVPGGLGQYHIDQASRWSLENLRPLRSPGIYQTVDEPEQP